MVKGQQGKYPILTRLANKLSVFPEADNERSILYIENLCEFICKLILCGEGGIYFPQNKEYAKTSEIVNIIAKASGKKTKNLKVLKPAVKIAGKVPGKIKNLVNKAFGNSCYGQELSEYSFEYRLYDLEESIIKTEE